MFEDLTKYVLSLKKYWKKLQVSLRMLYKKIYTFYQDIIGSRHISIKFRINLRFKTQRWVRNVLFLRLWFFVSVNTFLSRRHLLEQLVLQLPVGRYFRAAFPNWSSTEPKGSASQCQGFREEFVKFHSLILYQME